MEPGRKDMGYGFLLVWGHKEHSRLFFANRLFPRYLGFYFERSPQES